MRNRLCTFSTIALATSLALTGCGDSGSHSGGHGDSAEPSASASSAAFNDADAKFATMMIPHHQQAIEMSDMLLAKDGADPKVAQLAKDVKEAQGPEIEQLKKWSDEWNVEADHGSGHAGHGDGMMSGDDMKALEDADGPSASKLYLEQMIEHHEGAVAMAKTEIEEGQHAEAVDMAREIVASQTKEIETMRTLLSEL